jgi:hypothetical protein
VNVPLVAGVTTTLVGVLLLLVVAVFIVRRRSRRQTHAWRERLLTGRFFSTPLGAAPAPRMREPSFPIQPPQMASRGHQTNESVTRPLNAPAEPEWDMVAPGDYGGVGAGGGLGAGRSGSGNGLGFNFSFGASDSGSLGSNGGDTFRSGGSGFGFGDAEAALEPPRAPMLIEGHDSFYASDPFAAPAPEIIPPSPNHGVSASMSTVDSLYSQNSSGLSGRGHSPYAM